MAADSMFNADVQSDFDLLSNDLPVVNDPLKPEEERHSDDEPPADDETEVKDEVKEEEEEEVKEEEQEEEPLLYGRPTIKQINEKYPEFFKTFPDLKHAFFREQEYSSVFPTVDDAKEAASKVESFDALEQKVLSGSPDGFKDFLSAVEEGKKGALTSVAANFLPSLYSVNKDLYFSVTMPLLEQAIKNAYKAGVSQNNDNLKHSAAHVAQFLFGDAAYAVDKSGPRLEAPKAEEGKSQLELEKAEFFNQRYQALMTDVTTEGVKSIRNEIRKDLDPNTVFNEFTRKSLENAIFDEIDSVLDKDELHVRNMNALWQRASKAGFTGEWKDRIKSAYLSRARSVMPGIRNRLRKEALAAGKAPATKADRSENEQPDRSERGPRQSRDRVTSSVSKLDPREVDWTKTSDEDLISGKATLRK